MLACPRCRATYPDNLAECPVDGTALLPSELLPAIDAPLEPGTMIGEYRIERKLGSGTFGEVYAGEQPLIGKQVAIKLLHRKYSSDAEVVSRFVAEARAVNRIRHRHIIDIFSFGLLSDENRHYFVMELLDGLTLGQLLERERRLPLEVALPIFRGIAGALDAAHEAGITHRDLKPDNIFLAIEKDGGYFAKLLDFGIAKLMDDEVAHKTATGIAIGTPRYMSPEQCRGKKVDYKADIYSLGVVIHEVLTGQPLFDGDSAMDVLFKHTSETPPSMSSVCPELPPELDEPVLEMLAKRPKQRPESAGAAVAGLVARARASGQAATLPVSSKHPASSSRTVIASGDGPPVSADVATVAVRQRGPRTPPAAPLPSGLQLETATVQMAPAVSAADPSDRSAPAHTSTEIAPASAVSGTLLRDVKEPPSGETSAERSDSGTLRSARPAAAVTAAPVTAGDRRAEPTRPRGVPVWGIVAVGVLAVVGVIAAVSRRTPERDSATTSLAVPLDATSAGPAAAASSSTRAAEPLGLVKIRLSVTPPEAVVWFDDRRVGSARDALMLPRSSESHVVRVEHEGYEPVTLWVVPDRDVDLAPISLTRAAPVTGATTSSAAASGTGTASGKPLAKPIVPKAIEPNPFQR